MSKRSVVCCVTECNIKQEICVVKRKQVYTVTQIEVKKVTAHRMVDVTGKLG